MLIDIKVPILAESISEATLLNWKKRVGEQVKRGEKLIDIETDKVTLEVAALNDGVMAEIIKNDGETAYSDEVIARIDTETKADAHESQPTPVIDTPQQQNLPEMDTHIPDTSEKELPKLSPAVRHLVKEQPLLEITEIPTKTGRITKKDVLAHLDKHKIIPEKSVQQKAAETTPEKPTVSNIKQSKAPPTKPAPIPVITKTELEVPELTINTDKRSEEKIPMTRLRKRTSERLLKAQKENAILTTFNEINMGPVIDIRKTYKDEFEKTHGIKLGFMSFFTHAVTEALKKFPIINASIDGDNIIYHGYFDIGIAVSSPRGLVVPIIRNTNIMSLAEIETHIHDYGEKAKNGKLTIEDLTGGTFTITNGGVFGSLLSTPIINPPQSAILGMHTIQERAVVEEGNIIIRPMMYVALSYDHRIIDGREAVQFLISVKKQLENPARLLLQI